MSKTKNYFLLFTCEHAKNAIPAKYKNLFLGKKPALASHRGFDWGVFYLTKKLSHHFKARAVYGKYSRLLVDLNRSEDHRTAFSEVTKDLPESEKMKIKIKYHRPHWEEVQKIIDKQMQKGKTVIHIGVHSFTPVLNGKNRTAELGLLYDSSQIAERKFAILWQKALKNQSELRIRRNYPYLGKDDGLTTALRKKYSANRYMGFEIEVNQGLTLKKSDLQKTKKLLSATFKETVLNMALLADKKLL